MREKNLFSLLIIAIGIALFFSYHIYYYFVDVQNNNLVKEYYQNEEVSEVNIKKINNEEISDMEEYDGILVIPKINLETGFYKKNSSKNNVGKSVTVLNESIMPEESGSIVYLAAHSGLGHLAFFKDLDKLSKEDMVYLDYHQNKYSYVIRDIYEIPKNGKITVNHNINEKYLVLTTCSKNKNMQLVIVSKMLNRVWYNI